MIVILVISFYWELKVNDIKVDKNVMVIYVFIIVLNIFDKTFVVINIFALTSKMLSFSFDIYKLFYAILTQ